MAKGRPRARPAGHVSLPPPEKAFRNPSSSNGSGALDTGGGETHRFQATGGRHADMERLDHRAEVLAQAGGHACGDRQGMARPAFVEPFEAGDRRRGPDSAERGGRVEAEGVVAESHGLTQPDQHLRADGKGLEHLPSGSVALPAHSQQGGQYGRTRMADRQHADVVIVEDVARHAVQQRRIVGPIGFGSPERSHGRAALRRLQRPHEGAHPGLPTSCNRHGKCVQNSPGGLFENPVIDDAADDERAQHPACRSGSRRGCQQTC